jgi:hypothetical protein
MVAGAGLALKAWWAWRLALIMAVLQILVTVATQAWKAMAMVPPGTHTGFQDFEPAGPRMVLGLASVVFWSIVPVGILVLAAVGRLRTGAN